MTESKIRLADGREIQQVSSFVRNLAVDLSTGIAEAILEQHALAAAKRIWPEEPCELLKVSLSECGTPLFPQYMCMGEFISSSPLPNSAEIASSLVVVWFQISLTPECEKRALQELRSVNWVGKARGFSW